jgi:peptidyl-prolyl cis-trans isomerase B (cyclophilin B)
MKIVEFNTSRGIIIAYLSPLVPNIVANFETLVNRGFYNNLKFHRVVPNFMIQTGCPLGTGYGSAGYVLDDEFHPRLQHFAGTLSMANSGPNTNSSQFFITHVACSWLNGKHSVFGQVVEGMDVVNSIQQGDIIHSVRIKPDGIDVLKSLNNTMNLGDLVYIVKAREELGWDGPKVKAWDSSCASMRELFSE